MQRIYALAAVHFLCLMRIYDTFRMAALRLCMQLSFSARYPHTTLCFRKKNMTTYNIFYSNLNNKCLITTILAYSVVSLCHQKMVSLPPHLTSSTATVLPCKNVKS